MHSEVVRVEPLSTYLESWKAPTSAVTRAGDLIWVSGLPWPGNFDFEIDCVATI